MAAEFFGHSAEVVREIQPSAPPSIPFDHFAPMIRPRVLTALCFAGMMSLAIGLNLLPVFLVDIRDTFGGTAGLSGEELGRLGGTAFLGLVVGIVLTGPLADRWGAKPFAIGGNLLTVVGLAAMALSPSYPTLLGALFVVGLGAGMLDMILSPVVAAVNAHARSGAMNWLHSFYSVGAVVTILAAVVTISFGGDWRLACWLVMPLPLILIVAFGLMEFPSLVTDQGRLPMGQLLRRWWFAGAMVAIFLGGATELGLAQWLPAYAEESLGFSTTMAGTGLLLFSVAMALGRMVAGAIGNRINPYRIMVAGCGSSVVLFLLGAYLPHPGWALSACIAAGFTGSCLWPTMLAVAADHYPDGGASMFAALAALGNAGGIFMPWVVGWVGDLSSLSHGIAVSALAPFLMIPLILMLAAGSRRKSAS